ncbi:hypothetical protein VTN49DRAFT_8003 [Thermomyces lanuginosus]|uniref:uncharacterized protein n=1 Tax=Thermomyces lanuginosus TaxID=5541 RepID=UPI0037447534
MAQSILVTNCFHDPFEDEETGKVPDPATVSTVLVQPSRNFVGQRVDQGLKGFGTIIIIMFSAERMRR